jgi:NADH-quinone oxidoreductase subunit G
LPYDSLDALRRKLFEDHPTFMSVGVAPGAADAANFDVSGLGKAGSLSTEPLTNPISDFYMTNPIARASNVMAECSQVIEDRDQIVKEAAE